MKTLLFTLEYPPTNGGVANYYYNLEKNWPEASNFKVLFRKYFPSPFQYILYFQDLKRFVRSEKIDYILVGQILPLGSVTYLFSLLFRKPYAVFLHGMDFPLSVINWRKIFLTRRILGRSKKIICANNYVAKLVRDFSPKLAGKIIVVNPGVGMALDVNPQRIAELRYKHNLANKKVIITIGRLVKRKGVDAILSVLELLGREKTSDWRYIVLGAGPDEEYLKNICHVKGLDDLVAFVGSISEEDKWAWLEICDLFALPARNIAGDFEGFGIVYLEANLAGKAVLAGDSGGVSDAVLNGLNGLLVDPEDVNDISIGLEKLMNNNELRDSLGQKGLARARVDFNWQKQAKQIYLEINS
ncbi:MAG: glycosyltransferase family 4 protein [Patescibacteria group bacterium]|jgi:phosphatidylinositol alpha-1,6-mannosyltransferase